MDEFGARLDAEVKAMLGTADVHVLDFCAFREVLHHGSAVEDGVHLQAFVDILGDVAENDVETLSEEFLEGLGEVVVEQGAEAALSSFLALATYHTVDVLGIAVDQFAKDVDSQIARRTGDQYVAKRMTLACAEEVQCVALQQVVDGGVVEGGHRIVHLSGILGFSCNEAGEFAWSRVGEHFAIRYVESGLVGLDDDAGDNE